MFRIDGRDAAAGMKLDPLLVIPLFLMEEHGVRQLGDRVQILGQHGTVDGQAGFRREHPDGSGVVPSADGLCRRYRRNTPAHDDIPVLGIVLEPNRGERPMYFVQNSNPAIITQEMFDRAAQLRSSRRNETCNMEARPFAKKLSCGCCGSLLRSKRIDNTWYWVCRKHEESKALCEMPPVPENEIKAAFQRLHYGIKHNTAVLDFYAKHLILVRNRQMLWSPAVIELNKEISDILDQSHTLSLLNRQGMVDPDIFITKNNQLAEQLRQAKQQKIRLQELESSETIDATRQTQEALLAGPEILDAFDEELFCELIDRITVQSNTQVRFRLKNGLELTESMERTVR